MHDAFAESANAPRDGILQVTHDGHPLHANGGDTKPGSLKGDHTQEGSAGAGMSFPSAQFLLAEPKRGPDMPLSAARYGSCSVAGGAEITRLLLR